MTLMGLGTVVGFLIIISAVLIAYITTGAVSSLEFLFNIAAVALFLSTGILILQQSRGEGDVDRHYQLYNYKHFYLKHFT